MHKCWKTIFKNIQQKHITKDKASVVNMLTWLNLLYCSCNFSVSLKLCQNKKIKRNNYLQLHLPLHWMSTAVEWEKMGHETLFTLPSEYEHHARLSAILVFYYMYFLYSILKILHMHFYYMLYMLAFMLQIVKQGC